MPSCSSSCATRRRVPLSRASPLLATPHGNMQRRWWAASLPRARAQQRTISSSKSSTALACTLAAPPPAPCTWPLRVQVRRGSQRSCGHGGARSALARAPQERAGGRQIACACRQCTELPAGSARAASPGSAHGRPGDDHGGAAPVVGDRQAQPGGAAWAVRRAGALHARIHWEPWRQRGMRQAACAPSGDHAWPAWHALTAH